MNKRAINDLQLLIINNTKNWINDWCLLQVVPEVTIESCSQMEMEKYDFINFSKNNDKFFFVMDHEAINWEKLILSNLRLANLQNPEIKKLLDAAIRDLLDSLFWPHNKKENPISFDFPKHIKTYIRIHILFGDAGACEIISPHWIWPNPEKINSQKLGSKVKRNSLANGSTVTLSLSLDAGHAPITELKNIIVGTVIKLEPAIANKFSLNVASHKIANVALGKLDTNKAFIILKE